MRAGAACRDIVMRKFSIGATATTVGIVDASEDVELAGPQALTPMRRATCSCSIRSTAAFSVSTRSSPQRSRHFQNARRTFRRTISSSTKADILVWDGSVRTLKAAANQPSTRAVDGDVIRARGGVTRGVDDPIVTSAFAQMGSQPPGAASDLLDQNTRDVVIKKTRQPDRQYVASRSKGSVIADVIPNKGDSSVRIEIQTMDTNESMPRSPCGCRTSWARWNSWRSTTATASMSWARMFPIPASRLRLFVARYASNGKLEGAMSFR